MPIKPIDLQTLFMQLSQVGKEQAAAKDGALLHAHLHGTAVKRLEDEAAKAVQRPKDDQAAAKSVNGDGGSGAGAQGGERRREEKPAGDDEAETISDPSLGGHVDISG
ncbi:MAG TPA: hypothetical protein P5298_01015 [Spirochaetia bacterium]|nr:hypothetical protein [Spirochaetaceae bacterium]HPE88079.1 hypothetical protein [Spirochaetales bacterium]HRW22974.1 hypothetical protein [Spirochaetia bacterium]